MKWSRPWIWNLSCVKLRQAWSAAVGVAICCCIETLVVFFLLLNRADGRTWSAVAMDSVRVHSDTRSALVSEPRISKPAGTVRLFRQSHAILLFVSSIL